MRHTQAGFLLAEGEPVVVCACGTRVPFADWARHVDVSPFRAVQGADFKATVMTYEGALTEALMDQVQEQHWKAWGVTRRSGLTYQLTRDGMRELCQTSLSRSLAFQTPLPNGHLRTSYMGIPVGVAALPPHTILLYSGTVTTDLVLELWVVGQEPDVG